MISIFAPGSKPNSNNLSETSLSNTSEMMADWFFFSSVKFMRCKYNQCLRDWKVWVLEYLFCGMRCSVLVRLFRLFGELWAVLFFFFGLIKHHLPPGFAAEYSSSLGGELLLTQYMCVCVCCVRSCYVVLCV